MTRPQREPLESARITMMILRLCAEDFSLARPTGFLVGFSGGNDSLALAIAMAQAGPALGAPVRLVHVDHHLRPESSRDAAEALALAASIGLPCEVRTIAPGVVARHPGVGIEEAARRERYAAFAGELRDGEALVLAHHADDQAETLLMHLARGAGAAGGAGMASLERLRVPWWSPTDFPMVIPVWRPLLMARRADLAALVAATGSTPVDDASNDDEAFTRNAVRQRVVPALEANYPQAVPALARYAAMAQGEDAYLARVAADAREQLEARWGGLLAAGLTSLDVAIARRVVHAWLRDRGAPEPTFERVEAVRDLSRRADPVAVLEVGGGVVAGWFDGALRAGTLGALQDVAHRDAGLALPLASRVATFGAPGTLAGIAASQIVHLPDLPRGSTVARMVKGSDILPTGEETRDWLRRHRVSPWIRQQVIGVYDDRGLRAIPGIGDNGRVDMEGPTVAIGWTWATEGARE